MTKSQPDRFKALRKISGFSQEEIANLMESVNPSTISRIESRKEDVCVRVLFAYHILFEVPMHEIVPELYDEIRQTIISNVDAFQRSDKHIPMQVRHYVRNEFLQRFRERQRNKINYESKH